MKLGAYSRSRRVLKLVHPGGFAEIHKNPITAAEVMEKNPRHCVTRPDVFTFPWIVVHPESLLKPGNVFFIVPHHTIHRLMKGNRSQSQTYLPQLSPEEETNLITLGSWAQHEVKSRSDDGFHFHEGRDIMETSVEITCFHQLMMEQCSVISETRTKIDCKCEDWHEDAIFPQCLVGSNKPYLDQCLDKKSTIESHFKVKTEQHADDSPKKLYRVEQWPAVEGYKSHRESKEQSPINSFVEPTSSISSYSAYSDAEVADLLPDDGGLLELSSSQEDRMLKSCLKKNNLGKSRGFRVKFVLPGDDVKKLRVKSS